MAASEAGFDGRALGNFATGTGDFGVIQNYGDKLAQALEPKDGVQATTVSTVAQETFSEMISDFRELLSHQSTDMGRLLLTHTFLEVADQSGILDALGSQSQDEGWWGTMVSVAQTATGLFGGAEPSEPNGNDSESLMQAQLAIKEDYSAMMVEVQTKQAFGSNTTGIVSSLQRGDLRGMVQDSIKESRQAPQAKTEDPGPPTETSKSSKTTASEKPAAQAPPLQKKLATMAAQYTPDKVMTGQHFKGMVQGSARSGLSKTPLLAKGAGNVAEHFRATLAANLQTTFVDNPENAGRLAKTLEDIPASLAFVVLQTLERAGEEGKDFSQVTAKDITQTILDINKNARTVKRGANVGRNSRLPLNKATLKGALHAEIAENLTMILTQKDLASASSATRFLGKVKALPIKTAVESIVLPMAEKEVKKMLEDNPMTKPFAKFAPVLAAYAMARVTNDIADMAKNPEGGQGRPLPSDSVVTEAVTLLIEKWTAWAGKE